MEGWVCVCVRESKTDMGGRGEREQTAGSTACFRFLCPVSDLVTCNCKRTISNVSLSSATQAHQHGCFLILFNYAVLHFFVLSFSQNHSCCLSNSLFKHIRSTELKFKDN